MVYPAVSLFYILIFPGIMESDFQYMLSIFIGNFIFSTAIVVICYTLFDRPAYGLVHFKGEKELAKMSAENSIKNFNHQYVQKKMLEMSSDFFSPQQNSKEIPRRNVF
mmetsp:Transcript_39936/g.38490  ORF Transcript_39936/g.38490 Transcript_39936/m.38490 type:complete len:108 (-) Transcript_39936:45-368(-)